MPSFSLKHPYSIIVLCLVICILGLIKVLNMPVDMFPPTSIPVEEVATFDRRLPMACKLETGSEAYARLARAIMGGLLCSIAVTIFVVPAAYLLLYRNREQAGAPVLPRGAQ